MTIERKQFRQDIFCRDSYSCVICKNEARDVHHIMDRKLFKDGGYYLDNLASLCSICHWKAETTYLTCEEIREAIDAKDIILPDHFDPSHRYDKWGNIITPTGYRIAGPLFYDDGFQKILEEDDNLRNLFAKYVKYPRTYHLPWSPNLQNDDRVLPSTKQFEGKEVVVTLKMDGENTSLYNDYMHARSIDSPHHPSRDLVKQLHSSICYDIPEGWRICGENLHAEHSIRYENLQSYFMIFSIWDDNNYCLSWDETVGWARMLNVCLVPVIYRGVWNPEAIEAATPSKYIDDDVEGYVVRITNTFHYNEHWKFVGKSVRELHVQTDKFWKQNWKPNKLGDWTTCRI